MNKTATNLLRILDAAIAPASKPIANPGEPRRTHTAPPRVQMVKALLSYASLPDAATQKKLDALAVAFAAEMAQMQGWGHDDALAEHARIITAAIEGEMPPERIPSQAELIRDYSLRRDIWRQRAAKVSNQAGKIAAEVLVQAKDKLPAYRDFLAKQEQAIFSHEDLANSPLMATVDALPRLLDVQIEDLNNLTMTNPATLLK